MKELKVGDRVRVVNERFTKCVGWPVGTEGTVCQIRDKA